MFSTWYGLWWTKDLTKRTLLDKVSRNKAFEIESNSKYDGYQRGITSMEYNFFDKISRGSGVATLPNKYMPNYQLANKLYRQIIRTFKRRKVYSSSKDNIWGVDLADMNSLSKF